MSARCDASERDMECRLDAIVTHRPRPRSMLRAFRSLDALTSAPAHLRRKTSTGAVVSLCGTFVAVILTLSQTIDFFTPLRTKTTRVDEQRAGEMTMDIDVTFTRMPCQILYVDAYDASGKHEVDVRGRLMKTRLDAAGRELGEYESAGGVDLGGLVLFRRRPEHGSEVRKAKADMEGCRLHGRVEARRVAGSLRISTGPESFGFLREMFNEPWEIDARHAIKTFAFGPEFPGSVNPLNGVKRKEKKSGIYKYFMKVVPTTYANSRNLFGMIPWTMRVRTNQYSVTEHFTESAHWGMLPQILFSYDISAISVNVESQSKSGVYFLTKTIATVGGVFALTRTIDRYVDLAVRVTSTQ